MLLKNDMVYEITVDLHSSGFDTPMDITGKLRNRKGSKDLYVSQIFHCDGLMLCSTKNYKRLVVWNPCTGQRRRIKPRTCYHKDDTYALGYSKSSSSDCSYKILRSSYNKNEQKVRGGKCEIYEVSSDSWRVLDYLTIDYALYCHGMSLKGDTYFVDKDDETNLLFLAKFDFTRERFMRLPLPLQSFKDSDTVVLSVVMNEKLSVLHIGRGSNVMRIWVTNKVDDNLSWRSDIVLQVDFGKFEWDVDSFLLDEENKVALCCDEIFVKGEYKTRIYIVGEDMFKQVFEDDAPKACSLSWPLVISYVPSLVRIHKRTPKRHKRRRLSLK